MALPSVSLHEVGVRLDALDVAAAAYGQLSCLARARDSDPDWAALVATARGSLRIGGAERPTPRRVLRAAAAVEPAARQRLDEARRMALAALEALLCREMPWDARVAAELARIETEKEERHVLLARQYPVVEHFAALRRLLNSRTWLAVVDLSNCFLGDDRVGVLIGALASQQHLRILSLDANGITSRLEPLLTSLLSSESAQRSAVATFPSLRWLGLSGNPIATRVPALRASWKSRVSVRLRPRAPWRSPQRCVRVLVVEGAGMEAIVPALAWRRVERERDHVWEGVDVLCAASFATITAVGIALQLPAERIVDCFATIATRVFAIPFVLQPFYALCAWWSSMDYYSAESLEAVVRELFGDAADMTLAEIEVKTGKHLLFFTACKAVGFVPLRSWDHHTSSLTLVDAILACCCASGLVGPARSIAGRVVSDAFVVPVEALLCECLENTDDATAVQVAFWLPREDVAEAAERAPVSLLRNPLLLREVIRSREGAAASAAAGAPSPALLAWRRRRGTEWLAVVLRGECPLSLVEGGARVRWSVIPLLKTSEPHEVRYEESDVQRLTKEVFEATSAYAIIADNGVNKALNSLK